MKEEKAPQKQFGCYGNALANFLLQTGDTPTALKVFYRFSEHPLVMHDGGISQAAIPKITEDLTLQKYQATVYSNYNRETLEQSIREKDSENAEEIMKLIDEEEEQGRLIACTGGFRCKLPSIFLLAKHPTFNGSSGHAVLYMGEGLYIDYGDWKKYSKDQIKLCGVVEISPNPHKSPNL